MIACPGLASSVHDIEMCTLNNTVCCDKHHEQFLPTQIRVESRYW